jgi:predicted regulator of Ras-like GTPase activity (Roadblock/LC7/MglB family)
MTRPSRATDSQLDWLLIDFVRSTPGVRHGLVVAADGLRLAASERLDEALGDRLAAVTSGLSSLAENVSDSFTAGPVQQTIIEMAGGYLFITPVSGASSLTVYADRNCDMGLVGYEMTLLAERVGHVLTPSPRTGEKGLAR